MANYKKRIQQAFNMKASSYDEYSVAQREVGRRMIERLDLLKFKPLNILDLGSGTGYLAELLLDKFPESNVTCLDLAESIPDMLELPPEFVSKRQWVSACEALANISDAATRQGRSIISKRLSSIFFKE